MDKYLYISVIYSVCPDRILALLDVECLGVAVLKQLLSLENTMFFAGELYRSLKRNTAALLGCIVVFGLSVLGYKVVYLACRKKSSWLCRTVCTLSAPLILPVCALVTWTLASTILEVLSLPAYLALDQLPEVLAVTWLDYRWFCFITDIFHNVVSFPIRNQLYMASAEFMAMGIVLSVFPALSAAFSWRPCRQAVRVRNSV